MPLTQISTHDAGTCVVQAVEALNGFLHQALHEEGRPVLLLLSGSADPAVFRSLDCIHENNFTKGLTISILDERHSRAQDQNLFLQLSKSPRYQDAKDLDVRFLSTVPEDGEMLFQFADRIDQEFRDWQAVHRDGRIITTQGISSSGTTAGLLVTLTAEDFQKRFSGHEWIVGVPASRQSPIARLTPTTPFLTELVDATIMCVMGEDKAWALRELAKEGFKDELFTLPARVANQMHDVRVFVPDSLET